MPEISRPVRTVVQERGKAMLTGLLVWGGFVVGWLTVDLFLIGAPVLLAIAIALLGAPPDEWRDDIRAREKALRRLRQK